MDQRIERAQLLDSVKRLRHRFEKLSVTADPVKARLFVVLVEWEDLVPDLQVGEVYHETLWPDDLRVTAIYSGAIETFRAVHRLAKAGGALLAQITEAPPKHALFPTPENPSLSWTRHVADQASLGRLPTVRADRWLWTDSMVRARFRWSERELRLLVLPKLARTREIPKETVIRLDDFYTVEIEDLTWASLEALDLLASRFQPPGSSPPRDRALEIREPSAPHAQVPDNSPLEISRPAVILNGQGKPVIVFGQEHPALTHQQYAAVEALLKAGDDGLSKDDLTVKSTYGDGLGLLKRVRKLSPAWETAIVFPGRANGRYRIKPAARGAPTDTH